MTMVEQDQIEHRPLHYRVITEILDSGLSVGDVIRLNVISNSMKPLMSTGDQIIAEITPTERLKFGDIIVIRRNDDYLTHRIIQHRQHTWVTKGDNNIMPDPQISSKQIVGRVEMIEKGNQLINLQARKWSYLNPILGKLSALETRAFILHPLFRSPFRLAIKILQKMFF